MFRAAAGTGNRVDDENVPAAGHVAEKTGLGFDDLREVGLESFGVIFCAAPDRNLVRLSIDVELQ